MKLVWNLLFFLIFCITETLTAVEPFPDLRHNFQTPPAEARPWVYWFWMDGNITREGITADMEAMDRAGIGGMIMMEVNVGVPGGPVVFMSGEWRDLFKHAVNEARRLGLEITINAGPGWTGSGGPWVKPEESMQHIVSSTVEVTGPVRFDGVLPRPQRRKAYFGEKFLPAELVQTLDNFYRDVCVLAFPTPEGKERIADINEKALYIRDPYSSKPGVKPYLLTPWTFTELPANTAIKSSGIVDLTDRLMSDGRLSWEVPGGNWTIMRFGRVSTGANTRPAPVTGIGLESDKFDRAALDRHFENFIGTLRREIGTPQESGGGWTMLHIDSWEMGAQNWTAAFRDEFRRRRGCDPMRYLPAMTGMIVDNLEISERFLWDVRLTAQELIVENHAEHLKELAHRNGFGLSIEPYDMNPTADLTLGAVADVPMCEFWNDAMPTLYSCVEATSIAHVWGRPVVAAEAFTDGTERKMRTHPGTMKALGDWALCMGINRFVFHRFAHNPWPRLRPGMTMGMYGSWHEGTQTWWELSGGYHRYLSRCQYLLRQGQAVADICYLVPEGAPNVFTPPVSAAPGTPPERQFYHFDGCSPEALLTRAEAREGQLVFRGGTSYRLLILPQAPAMTPRLLEKIRELVEAGVPVMGLPPLRSPGLSDYPECNRRVQTLVKELWGEGQIPDGLVSRSVGRGKIFWGEAIRTQETPANPGFKASKMMPGLYPSFDVTRKVLAELGVPPDFTSDKMLRFGHRRTGEMDLFFVANPHGENITSLCTFRVTGSVPELWDPMTGRIWEPAMFETKAMDTRLTLNLAPAQSVFVVFKPLQKPGDQVVAVSPPAATVERTADGKVIISARTGGKYELRMKSGKTLTADVPAVPEPITITGPWRVQFPSGMGAPDEIELPELANLSAHPQPGVRYFSGISTYSMSFQLPPSMLEPGHRVELDLGRVAVMAEVILNGRNLGVVWIKPYRVDATDAVQSGTNELKVRVANLWANRLIGDAQLPEIADYGKDGLLKSMPEWLLKGESIPSGRVTFMTYRFFGPDDPLPESGLIGPVRLESVGEAEATQKRKY